MLKKLSFRSKLLLVLFVPFLALVVVAAAGLSDRFSALRAQEQYGALAGPLARLSEASRAIENESVVSSWSVAGTAPSEDLFAARKRTDVAVKAFEADHQAFVDSGIGSGAIAALDQAERTLVGLDAERRKVDAKSVDAAQVRGWYMGADDDLLTAGERVARGLAAPATSAAVTRSYSLQRAQHELAHESSVYIAVLASGQQQGFSEWLAALAGRERAVSAFTATADPAELSAFTGAGLSTDPVELPTAFPATATTPADELDRYQTEAGKLDEAIAAVDGTIRTASNAAASAAESDVRLYGGAAVLAMLLTLGLMWFVSKAVVGPVRRLTAAAREMSQEQLPALVESLRTGADVSTITPTVIDVQSEDEIGELAQAFNDVEQVTLEVAQQQSLLLRKGMGDLFVNLARRNQSLLERQLELLDELERNEHDPSQLDSLFKLDHMATRMRRNAESLLVLSGAEQPRQWQESIGLLDVVRSAAAEIADFPRVELVGIDERISVSGRAVADVSHLLAELLENATSFSSPESAVVVSGAITRSGFVLAITDQGIGMAPERIAESNQLLRHPPVVGLALSRALGLHVVGALAKRHGIAVEIRKGSPIGTVALVALPKAILEARGRSTTADHTVPTYSPDVDGEGAPAPLGARRAGPATTAGAPTPAAAAATATADAVTWHPADEPPVEQWAREVDAQQHAASAAAATDFLTEAPAPVEPEPQPEPYAEPAAEWQPDTAFAAAPEWQPEPTPEAVTGPAPQAFAPDAFTAEQFVAEPVEPVVSAEPVEIVEPVAYAEPAEPFTAETTEFTSTGSADAFASDFTSDFGGGSAEFTADFGDAPAAEELPLPTRVPGMHLLHEPVVSTEGGVDESDPMRPYRVHELLTAPLAGCAARPARRVGGRLRDADRRSRCGQHREESR
ncbi:MAG: nitrate- and nitrite sensing domain-containing protein [Acidimicrobiia bacterium]